MLNISNDASHLHQFGLSRYHLNICEAVYAVNVIAVRHVVPLQAASRVGNRRYALQPQR